MRGVVSGIRGVNPRPRKSEPGASSKLPVYTLPKTLGFRIRSLATSGSWWRVTELEGYKEENYAGSRFITGSQAGYNGATIADSERNGEIAAYAFDGNTATQWSSNDGSIGRYVGLNFLVPGTAPTLTGVAATLTVQQLNDDPRLLLRTFLEQIEAHYLPYMVDVKSVRWRTYNNGSNHFSPSVAVDFRRVNNLGEFSWEEVATIDGATSPNVYYGWASL